MNELILKYENDKGKVIDLKLPLKVPSMYIELEYSKLNNLLLEYYAKISKDNEELQNLQDATQISIELVEKAGNIDYDFRLKSYEILVNMIKVSVNTKSLTTAEKELFNSDYNSDFWFNQNKTELSECVKFFRTALNIGT
jgi:hypothetical protein